MRTAPEPTPALPVTLLTGFLGAGKTTVVNHLLSGTHGLKLAVLVNEFGRLGIDAALIAGAAGPVVELVNGCICCATQGDLARALNDLLLSGRDIDGALIETSGLADPFPVIAAIDGYRFARELRLSSVVTVLDALNFDANLDRAEAAFQQIVAADFFLINKVDLVGAEVPQLIERRVAVLNSRARTIACTSGRIASELVLDPPLPGDRRAISSSSALPHDLSFDSVVVTADAPLDPIRFDHWLDTLPRSVYRAKGFVRLRDQQDVIVVHLVGTRRVAERAPAGVFVSGANLVLIGRDIAAHDFRTGLLQCIAS